MAKGIKTGGRKKGSINKSSVPAMEVAERLGVDPFEVLLHFASGNWEALGYPAEKYISKSGLGKEGSWVEESFHIDPAVRCKAASEATQYLLPKRKALEVSTDIDPSILEMTKAFLQMPKEELMKLVVMELKKK